MTETTGISELERVDPLAEPAWDTWVEACGGETVFHSRSWARVLVETYGFKPAYFVLREGQRIKGILPMMEVKTAVGGRRGVGLPFSDWGSPLAKEAEDVGKLWDAALGYGRQRGWRRCEVRGELTAIERVTPSATYWRHTVPLCREAGRQWQQLNDGAKSAVRKADRIGVHVTFSGSMEAVRDFYGLHGLTRKRHGLPPQPWRFFQKIFDHWIQPGRGEVGIATLGGTLLAANMYLRFGRGVAYKFAAMDAKQQEHRGSSYLMWMAIKHFGNQGIEWMDLGRSGLDQSGLAHFKRSFGAEELPARYYRVNLRTGAFEHAKDRRSHWVSRVFQLMPLCVSRIIGSVLYKHLA